MITWSSTAYTAADDRTHTSYGAADHRHTALAEAIDAARTHLHTLTTDDWTTPYLSIIVDDDIILMLAVGHTPAGRPDTTTALEHLDALDTSAHQPRRIA